MNGIIKPADLQALARALHGLPVYGCLPGSPADRAGIRFGDVLLSVDGVATPSWDAYLAAREQSGASIVVRLFRDGIELDIELVLRRVAGMTAEDLASVLGLSGTERD
jgi:S1-C subfamily serine protease